MMTTKEFDLGEAALRAILEDFAEKTDSELSLILVPLGDGVAWKCAVATNDGEYQLSKATHADPIVAIETAVARGVAKAEEILEAAKADQET